MIPAPFEYLRAASVDEAINLLQQHGPEARVLAGGHSLLPSMKLRLDRPAKVIDISRLSELNYIRKDGNVLAIGALTTHAGIAASAEVQAGAPALAEAAGVIGDVQVRNMGTIGGSLAHADPAADYPAALLAHEAQIVVKGPGGERTIEAADFFQGLFTTALQEGELIVEVRVPAIGSGTGACYLKFHQPASRFALCGCAAVVTKSGNNAGKVRVAFTGIADSAFRDSGVEDALTGQPLDEAHISAAAEKAAEGKDLMSDHWASEEYRRHLARVYARKALTEAANRA